MKSDTFAYLVVLSGILGLLLEFPNWDRIKLNTPIALYLLKLKNLDLELFECKFIFMYLICNNPKY